MVDKKENCKLAMFDDKGLGQIIYLPCIILEDKIPESSISELCQIQSSNGIMQSNQYGSRLINSKAFYYQTFKYDNDTGTVKQAEEWPDDLSGRLMYFILIGDSKGFWPADFIVDDFEWRNNLK